MKTRSIEFISLFALVFAGLFMFAGCGNKGIEGTWVLVEEYESDGTKISSSDLKELGISEQYVVDGTTAEYTCEAPLMKKPVTMTFTVEQTGDNTYDFKIADDFVFVSPEVHGNIMTYTVGEGEDSMKMVFKRK
ncbi:MAG: hypothetical protein K6E12_03150 [Saccharofermentans sp.]|nr:hypothetical protein [Saccharofermentans sp.]